MTAQQTVQVRLRSGTAERTCWVNRGVRAGDTITLKDSEEPDRDWLVTEVSSSTEPPLRGWHVGGLV